MHCGIPGLGRSPGGGHGNPLLYACLEYSHGQRSLAGYSSWGCKESDTTEGLSIISRDMLAFTTEQVFKFWVVSPSEYHRGSGRVTQIGVGMNGGMNGCKKS